MEEVVPGVKFPQCLELVCYKPSRRSAKDRMATQYVIGITAWDDCAKCYRPIAEVDEKIPLDTLLSSWKRDVPRPVFIVETMKGYHIIMWGCFKNYHKMMHVLTSWKMLDRNHLKLGYLRAKGEIKVDFKGGWVLRVTPKYGMEQHEEFKIVYVGKYYGEPWYTEVLMMYMGFWKKVLRMNIDKLCMIARTSTTY